MGPDCSVGVQTVCCDTFTVVTAYRAAAALTAAHKQHKSRDADWLKNISSSKRSELLECELKKMTTVIVSECTAL